jgi:hypothetical protein
MKALRSILCGGLLASLIGAAGCYADTYAYGTYGYSSYGSVAVTSAPPAPADVYYESRAGYVYIQGRWVWSGSQWEWRPGYWEPQRVGYVYVDGFWDYRNSQYVYVDGYWSRERPGYTYVNGYWEPRGSSYLWVRGRWENNRPGHTYVNGYWRNDGGRRTWQSGYWAAGDRSRTIDQRGSYRPPSGGFSTDYKGRPIQSSPRSAPPPPSGRPRMIDQRGRRR